MNRAISTLGIAALVGAALAAGYWWGHQGTGNKETGATQTADAAKPQRKILYYRNAMGLPDTSPVPKKDAMGMDYVPVYEGEETAGNQISISAEKVQKLGVKSEAATMRELGRSVRAAGTLQVDEKRLVTVAPRFEGWIERLHVNATGQRVARGQALMEVYSPELVSAQAEYAAAAQSGMPQLAESSLSRLRNWGIDAAQVGELGMSARPRRTLTLRAPASGIVLEKAAVQGMRFMSGDALYKIADLSTVWVVADVFERDIGLVKAGGKARVTINAYPDKVFEGTITYVYPTLNAQTRTVPVRVELANPGMLLKPAMYAQVELPVGGRERVLTVPDSAVIDSGTRRVVLVRIGEGGFEPREVRLGARGDGYVEVLEGVAEGEQVVVAANFLIDAESNLKAAVGGMGGHAGHGGAPQADAAAPAVKQASPVHRAEGTVNATDPADGTVNIAHGPVESLKWPAMAMDYAVANAALLKGITPGTKVTFEFVERQPGEWVITGIRPLPGRTAPASPNPHAGH